MSEQKHTPGPWVTSERTTKLEGRRGLYRQIIGGPVTDMGSDIVAWACVSHPYNHGLHRHGEANASLIATAPELLEALEGLMALESRGRLMPIGREWDAARAAISKATRPA